MPETIVAVPMLGAWGTVDALTAVDAVDANDAPSWSVAVTVKV
jgi:hypothetical protein